LIFGTLACAAALACNSGLSAALDKQTHSDNGVQTSYAQSALASYFLFNIIFSFTYTPLQAVVPTEALETTTRAKGLAASGIIVNAVGFINQFAGPIALGNIGYKYIYIFVGWDMIESGMWYLFGYVLPSLLFVLASLFPFLGPCFARSFLFLSLLRSLAPSRFSLLAVPPFGRHGSSRVLSSLASLTRY
jgi:hypothetical protein